MVARRKKREAEPVPAADALPPWIWQFRPADWPLPDGPVRAPDGSIDIERYTAARRLWRKASAKWLAEHDRALWPHGGIGRSEYDRIAREEPWRILRRPPRP